MSKVYETVFEIAGKIAGSFDKSLLSAGKSLDRLGDRIKTLESAQGQVTRFRALKSEIGTTQQKFDEAQASVARLAAELRATATPTKQMTNDFERAKERAGALKTQLERQGQELQKLRTSLSGAGISTRSLGADQAALQARLQKTIQLQQKLREVQGAMQANMANRADMRGQMVDAVALGAATVSPIVMAAQFEKAMGGVAKQVAGARDESGQLTDVYYEMQKQIQQLGRETPIATNQIAEMVAAGARMGVAKDELIGFTRTAAMMASAFELPAGELADQMGKIAGLYKIPIPNINELADTINYLDDNAIAKGGDIISFLQRTGGVAGSVKITAKEMAALGSTLLTMGETTETAGTAVNAMIAKFAAADKGTAAFKRSMEEIGLTTDEVQQGMATDAAATFQMIAKAIQNLPEDQRVGVMVDLVGMEHQDTLGKLVNGLDEFQKQLVMANSEAAKGSMGREYQATLAQTSAQFEIMKNQISEVAVNLGSALLPSVNAVFSVIGPLAGAIGTFAAENKGLVSVIGGTIAGLAALKIGALAVGYAWTFVTGGALMVKSALLVMRTAWLLNTGAMAANAATSKVAIVMSKGLAAAQWLVNAAMTANPIGLVVVAIAALVAAGVALYQNWDVIVAKAGQLWSYLRQIWTNITNWFGSIDLFDVGLKIMSTIANGIISFGPKLIEKAAEVFAQLREYLPFSDAKKGPLSDLTASGRAIITTMGEGVNQAGASLQQPMTNALGNAMPQIDLGAAAAGASAGQGGGSFTFSPVIQVTGNNADQVRREVGDQMSISMREFERMMKQYNKNQGRLSYG
ncbi:tape measure protein [Pararheinheimera phage vB_PsoM_KLER1-1]|nr:tape measure protein [Pararheinheimera phage vB_PsoM_KLER1-1]